MSLAGLHGIALRVQGRHSPLPVSELSTVELKNQIEQTAQGSGFTEELGYGVIDAAAILGEPSYGLRCFEGEDEPRVGR